MRKLCTSALVGVLILTAVVANACHIRQVSGAAPESTVIGVPEQAEQVDDGSTTTTLRSPNPIPATTQPPAAPPTSEPRDDGDPEEPAAVAISDEPEQESEPSLLIAEVADRDWLSPGLESALRSWYPDRAFVLHPEGARGDLDGDGDDDAAVHVEARSAGSPQAQLLVPVINTGEAFDVRPPVNLGRRIIIDSIGIRDGTIEVSLFDRSPGEPLTMITRRTTLSVAVGSPDEADTEAGPPVVTPTSVEPIDHTPALQISRPSTPVALVLDGVGTAMSDRIELRERHGHAVHVAENEVVVATLVAPAGVWLEVRLGDGTLLVPITERTQRFAIRAPSDGEWTITVASSLLEPADYRLAVEVFGASRSGAIATRDLTGFWSSTRTSPPVLPDDGPVAYLTFDDGPHPVYTAQVLDVLARHGAKATFFVVGALAERYPLLVQRIAYEGHTLANHSWDHASLARVSRAAFEQSVGRTQELLGPLATSCLRPPYWDLGVSTREWSADLGLRLVSWSYSPKDWQQPTAQEVADGIVARTAAGAVILLHDGGAARRPTVRGLDMALERLSGSGLEFKPLCR